MLIISLIFIILSILQFILILIDIFKRPQKMFIMNIVWPLTGLYFPILGIIGYYTLGRTKIDRLTNHNKPFWQSVIISTTHCSAGCSLGNLIGAPVIFLFGITFFNNELATTLIIEFILAYIFGLLFQYFHMEIKHDHPLADLKDAVKADTFSLIAFEIGMFGFMIIMRFAINNALLQPNKLEYWFLMQIAMLIGFITSYPVNWYLVKKGIKHAM
ncbi:DUF4396 domain-containing protein [Staphylococcus sp. 18_1_E_LY]|jgi:hypothetical protein|uniref:DUF4396 domain-containing protein n=3 Tax=Staphylococcus TaxID=1279 RepID=A0A7T1AZ50_9STAP|nr:DUF4396 domain-containing protein [Staphylococcus lloydii]MBF7019193.1 DUF4396 domain-containing protein [Staphylococcus lloydii]MBF7022468.1 DUF4396 domain-containing protein [Staphylococcus kloosii]MBF7026921.1 DUF4396 domain-containing protein [Staphylococcus lloydii]QPM74571.1 DUF4396 domain-containing protein [Staphylococcus lloydii]